MVNTLIIHKTAMTNILILPIQLQHGIVVKL